MIWAYLTMGTCSLPLPLLRAWAKPPHLCNEMLRVASLMVAMHLWERCVEVNGDNLGDERYNLLFLVVLVVVDVVVVV